MIHLALWHRSSYLVVSCILSLAPVVIVVIVVHHPSSTDRVDLNLANFCLSTRELEHRESECRSTIIVVPGALTGVVRLLVPLEVHEKAQVFSSDLLLTLARIMRYKHYRSPYGRRSEDQVIIHGSLECSTVSLNKKHIQIGNGSAFSLGEIGSRMRSPIRGDNARGQHVSSLFGATQRASLNHQG